MLKSLGRKFWDFCPKYNRKIVKSGFYVSSIFLCANFFPEITTLVFVILGLRTKSFWTFIKRFSKIFETAVYVSTDKICGKKIFHQYRTLSQNFVPLFHKSARRISKLHLACPGEKFEENYCLFWKTKNIIWFFLVFLPKTYRKTC